MRYELFARAHKGAFAVQLTKGPAFWSKGWQGCPNNCGKPVRGVVHLIERIKYSDGVVTRGWYCR